MIKRRLIHLKREVMTIFVQIGWAQPLFTNQPKKLQYGEQFWEMTILGTPQEPCVHGGVVMVIVIGVVILICQKLLAGY